MKQIIKIILILIGLLSLVECSRSVKNTDWEVVKTFKSLTGLSDNKGITSVLIGFLNDKVGFAINKGNCVYYSADGGESWSETKINTNPCLSGFDIIDEKNIVIGCECSYVEYSSDMGKTWTKTEESSYPMLSFYNNNSGLIAQTTYNKNIKMMENFKSTKEIVIPEEYRNKSIAEASCLSSNEVYLLYSGKGPLLKTVDGGNSWEKIDLEKYKKDLIFQIDTTSMNFIDSNNGMIITFYPKEKAWVGLYTKDGGKTWNYAKLLKRNRGLKSYLSKDGNYLTLINMSNDDSIILLKRKI